MNVTVLKRMIINDLIKGKFSLELIERRTLRKILWRAVQLKVTHLLYSILVFGLLNAKVASVLYKSIFCAG